MYAVIGPGGATDNSLRKKARRMIKSTVSTNWFKNLWAKRNQTQNYAAINNRGEMVGFALVKRKGPAMKISLIGAEAGKGVGRQLMEHIVGNAEEAGLSKIYLDAVPEAVPFYMKMGFNVNKMTPNKIIMSLVVGSPNSSTKSVSPIKKSKSVSPIKKAKSISPIKKVLRRSIRVRRAPRKYSPSTY